MDCRQCGEPKTLEAFYTYSRAPNASRRRVCKACCKLRQSETAYLRRTYGAPPLGAPCQICGRTDQRLCVDHNHNQPDVSRGVLCHSCNRALGALKTDHGTAVLERALAYLGGALPTIASAEA